MGWWGVWKPTFLPPGGTNSAVPWMFQSSCELRRRLGPPLKLPPCVVPTPLYLGFPLLVSPGLISLIPWTWILISGVLLWGTWSQTKANEWSFLLFFTVIRVCEVSSVVRCLTHLPTYPSKRCHPLKDPEPRQSLQHTLPVLPSSWGQSSALPAQCVCVISENGYVLEPFLFVS